MDQILDVARTFDGVLVVLPAPGDGTPELAWGDAFLYYAPDGRMPHHTQPYATIVTKDYPGDTASRLDAPGRWRLNIQVAKPVFRELTGEDPRELTRPRDHAETDTIAPHPVYGAMSWIAVVNPGPATLDTALALLRDAHEAAKARHERRAGA